MKVRDDSITKLMNSIESILLDQPMIEDIRGDTRKIAITQIYSFFVDLSHKLAVIHYYSRKLKNKSEGLIDLTTTHLEQLKKELDIELDENEKSE